MGFPHDMEQLHVRNLWIMNEFIRKKCFEVLKKKKKRHFDIYGATKQNEMAITSLNFSVIVCRKFAGDRR